jgi:hypothetical protein
LLENSDGDNLEVEIQSLFNKAFTLSCTLLVKILSPSYPGVVKGQQFVIKIQDPRWAHKLREKVLPGSAWEVAAFVDSLQQSPGYKTATTEDLSEDWESLISQEELFLQELGLLGFCYIIHDVEERSLSELRSAGLTFTPLLVDIFYTKAWLPEPLLFGLDSELLQYPAILMEYFPGQTLSSVSMYSSIAIGPQRPLLEELSEALLEVIHELIDRSISLEDLHEDNIIVQREPGSGCLKIKVINVVWAHICTERAEDKLSGCVDMEVRALAMVARQLTGSGNISSEQRKLLTRRLHEYDEPDLTMPWRLFMEDIFGSRLDGEKNSLCAPGPAIELARVVGELLDRVISKTSSREWSSYAVGPICALLEDPDIELAGRRLRSIIQDGRSQPSWTDPADAMFPKRLLRAQRIFQHDNWHKKAATFSAQRFKSHLRQMLLAVEPWFDFASSAPQVEID